MGPVRLIEFPFVCRGIWANFFSSVDCIQICNDVCTHLMKATVVFIMSAVSKSGHVYLYRTQWHVN